MPSRSVLINSLPGNAVGNMPGSFRSVGLVSVEILCQLPHVGWELPNFPPKQNPRNPSAYNGKAFLGSKARQQSATLQSRMH